MAVRRDDVGRHVQVLLVELQAVDHVGVAARSGPRVDGAPVPAQVDRVERVPAPRDHLGEVALEEVVGEPVHVQHGRSPDAGPVLWRIADKGRLGAAREP
jgi:hypothetical protein